MAPPSGQAPATAKVPVVAVPLATTQANPQAMKTAAPGAPTTQLDTNQPATKGLAQASSLPALHGAEPIVEARKAASSGVERADFQTLIMAGPQRVPVTSLAPESLGKAQESPAAINQVDRGKGPSGSSAVASEVRLVDLPSVPNDVKVVLVGQPNLSESGLGTAAAIPLNRATLRAIEPTLTLARQPSFPGLLTRARMPLRRQRR